MKSKARAKARRIREQRDVRNTSRLREDERDRSQGSPQSLVRGCGRKQGLAFQVSKKTRY